MCWNAIWQMHTCFSIILQAYGSRFNVARPNTSYYVPTSPIAHSRSTESTTILDNSYSQSPSAWWTSNRTFEKCHNVIFRLTGITTGLLKCYLNQHARVYLLRFAEYHMDQLILLNNDYSYAKCKPCLKFGCKLSSPLRLFAYTPCWVSS